MNSEIDVRGARILLLEDDALISLDAEDMLLALGAARVYLAHTLEAAEAVLRGEPVDAAVLDLRIGRRMCDDLARKLIARDIPLVFASGWGGSSDLPEDIRHVPTVEKPYSAAALSSAFRALASPSRAAGRRPTGTGARSPRYPHCMSAVDPMARTGCRRTPALDREECSE